MPSATKALPDMADDPKMVGHVTPQGGQRAVHPGIAEWFTWPQPDPFRPTDDVMAGPRPQTDADGVITGYERDVVEFVVIRKVHGRKAWCKTSCPRSGLTDERTAKGLAQNVRVGFKRLPIPIERQDAGS